MIVAAPSTPSRKGRPSGNQSAMPQSVSVPVADDYYTYLEREEVEEVEELEEVEESEDEDCAESKVINFFRIHRSPFFTFNNRTHDSQWPHGQAEGNSHHDLPPPGGVTPLPHRCWSG
eukprot:GILJ01029622.1.p1 GENE.GILJ01029622.1~~GILJ01029622.1.p1  ORF type:complete len:118 (+),score=14.69 GILJ01029622.1:341-694(+)